MGVVTSPFKEKFLIFFQQKRAKNEFRLPRMDFKKCFLPMTLPPSLRKKCPFSKILDPPLNSNIITVFSMSNFFRQHFFNQKHIKQTKNCLSSKHHDYHGRPIEIVSDYER